MGRQVTTQTHRSDATAPKADGALVSRKCACGAHTIGGATCDGCRGDARRLKRGASQSEPSGATFDAHAQPHHAVHAQDLSRIPVHSEAPFERQPKLTVNIPGDAYEQDADRAAERVMSARDLPGVHGRGVGNQSIDVGLQAKRAGSNSSFETAAPPIVHEVLSSPGQPLDAPAREFMESRFGRAFDYVRVHTDAKAARSAREVNALAYTAGRDIVFGASQYQPHTNNGLGLLAHELSHTIQQGAAPYASAPATTIQRAMKFELQTSNVIWRTKGRRRSKLPRKFGPFREPKFSRFLHKGSKGAPATDEKEGAAVELQSEAGGFVEFETPSWLRDWCDVKERIQEAVDMVNDINHSTVVSTDAHGVDTVKFPFGTEHLKRTRSFRGGLRPGESLEVEIVDKDWNAKIQASESFALPQFESYLLEHMDVDTFLTTVDSADKVLEKANTDKLPASGLVNLKNFLQIIIEHITEPRKWRMGRGHLAKENISLMSRTNFSSMFKELLSEDEKKLFVKIVKDRLITKELGVRGNPRVFPAGFTGRSFPGPRIQEWLVSIHSTSRDRLSSLGGDNRAMGRWNVESEEGKKDTDLVKFEARATSGHRQTRPVVDKTDVATGVVTLGGWVAFAKEVFKAAHSHRARTDGTELTFDETNCP